MNLSLKVMSVRTLTRIAIMASIQSAIFTIFSQVLYLEGITFTVCLFACVFKKEEVVFASFIFAMVNMLVQGISIWTMMYAIIYPTYSFIIASFKNFWLKKPMALVAACGILSFATGQLLDLPFILFAKEITIFYIILGLKTSIIQGCLSAFMCLLIFEPCLKVLQKIEGEAL
ncbi:cytochrome B [Anaerorhabdus sp.]|nr:cytochrome B [Anaerorhabdus sp.]MEA4875341.1 cytochrome B [Anaerorhabdus sp.]